eukprot:1461457-Rhodomonas_salina.1
MRVHELLWEDGEWDLAGQYTRFQPLLTVAAREVLCEALRFTGLVFMLSGSSLYFSSRARRVLA